MMSKRADGWAMLVAFIIAGIFVSLLGVACMQDVEYYRAHGVWWGTPAAVESP